MNALTFFLFFLGLILLAGGAEVLVRGASRLASTFGIPSVVVGLTVVAFGTSSPELAVSIQAAMKSRPDITIGNVVGSNIMNILLILGTTAAVTPLAVSNRFVRREISFLILISIFVWLVCLNLEINRLEAGVFLVILFSYLVYSYFSSRQDTEQIKREYKSRIPFINNNIVLGRIIYTVAIAIGLFMLVKGSDLLVKSAVEMARYFGMSDLVIGLTVIAIGTSLPELATSLVATLRGEKDIAVGNVIGSSIFNLLCILGVVALIDPIPISSKAVYVDMVVMIAVSGICYPIFRSQRSVSRTEGILLLLGFIIYTSYLIMVKSS